LILKNGLLALGILIAIYFPWVLLVIPKFKESTKKAWAENAVFFGFALLWGLAILGMGAMTSKFYERYLLPVAPVLAVLLGWLLVRGGFELRAKGLKISTWFFLVLCVIVGVFGLWINIQLGSTVWIYLQIFLGLLILAYLFRLTITSQKLPKALSYSFLLLFFLLSTVTAKISLPEQGEQISLFVAGNDIDKEAQIGFIGNIHASSKIRVYLGPDYYMTDISGEKKLTNEEIVIHASEYKYLIVEDKYLPLFPESAYNIQVGSVNWNSKQIPFLLQNLSDPAFDSLVKENGKIYYWLEKKVN
jgi:hypothetical protein